MSRIGKQPVPIPKGVTIAIDGQTVTVKGSKGELSREFPPEIAFVQEGEEDCGHSCQRVSQCQTASWLSTHSDCQYGRRRF